MQADNVQITELPGLDPSKLSYEATVTPKALMRPENLVFGRNFTGNSPPRAPRKKEKKKYLRS